MTSSSKVTNKHRDLANEVLRAGGLLASIAQAIADAEERGRVAGLRECVAIIDDEVKQQRFRMDWKGRLGVVRTFIIALLPPEETKT